MTTNAIESQGVELQRGDGGGTEVFNVIGEVISFQGPGGQASVIDVTHLLSTAREKKIGLQDEGQVTLECNLVPGDTQQIGLRDDRTNRTRRNFRLVLTDGATTTLSFAAYVLGFSIQGAVDQVVRASITLEVDGPVTWA